MLKKIVSVIGSLFVVASTNAAMVSQMGDDVTFTYDDSTAYGVGTVVGNSIFFSPTTFIAESLNTDGAVLTTATLNIDVQVKNNSNFQISHFQLAEFGDYRLDGTSTSASAEGRLQVTSLTTTCGFFACNDFDLFNAGVLGVQGALTEWQTGGAVYLSDTVGWGADSQVAVQIQNFLTATALNDGDRAFIQKKFQGVGLTVSEVPVPAAGWLFGSALMAGLFGAKVRKH